MRILGLLVRPHIIVRFLLLLFLSLALLHGLIGQNAALLDGSYKLSNSFRLMLRGDESPLGFGSGT
jgi:succinate dehydrogenase hydrophobic anchor subunit